MYGNKKNPRVGVALYQVDPRTSKGITSYALNLLEGFRDNPPEGREYLLLVNPADASIFSRYAAPHVTIHPVPRRSIAEKKLVTFLQNYVFVLPILSGTYSFFDAILNRPLIQFIQDLQLDSLYMPSGSLFPMSIGVPSVVSIHDIQYVHEPTNFSWLTRQRQKTLHRETLRRARFIQASSLFSKNDFLRNFNCRPEKIVLIRDGVSNLFGDEVSAEQREKIRKRYYLPDEFVFYPAQHWVHKNHITLVQAATLLSREGFRIPLVFTGSKKYHSQALYDAVDTSEIRSDIHFIGNIPYEHLPTLYQLATIVCIPTLHESNSLPLMEALKSGVACVASDIEPNEELNINGAVTIFRRLDSQDLAEKIQTLWTSVTLREEKKRAGKKLMQHYSWQATAQEYSLLFGKIREECKDTNL